MSTFLCLHLSGWSWLELCWKLAEIIKRYAQNDQGVSRLTPTGATKVTREWGRCQSSSSHTTPVTNVVHLKRKSTLMAWTHQDLKGHKLITQWCISEFTCDFLHHVQSWWNLRLANSSVTIREQRKWRRLACLLVVLYALLFNLLYWSEIAKQ